MAHLGERHPRLCIWLTGLCLVATGCGQSSDMPRVQRPHVTLPPAASEPLLFAGSEAVRLIPHAAEPTATARPREDGSNSPDEDRDLPPVIRLPEIVTTGGFQSGPITPPIATPTSTSRLPRVEATPRPVASPPPAAAPFTSMLPGMTSARMKAVVNQAMQLHDHGFSLANRAAYFSAREEFLEAARILARGFDADQGGSRHATALAAGLRALSEAEDFVTHTSDTPENNEQLANLIAGHQTPVLHDRELREMTAAAMAQTYYSYAVDQLVLAVAPEPAGSRVLHSLGKLYGVLAKDPASTIVAADAKAAVLHHAALVVDPNNTQAANELAVLSASQGRYQEARQLLLRTSANSRDSGVWQNLAVVHARLGEAKLSSMARQAAVEAAGGGDPADPQRWLAQQAVQWMPVDTFAATSVPPTVPVAANSSPPGPPTTVAPPLNPPSAAVMNPEKTASRTRLWPWRLDNVLHRNPASAPDSGEIGDGVRRVNWWQQ